MTTHSLTDIQSNVLFRAYKLLIDLAEQAEAKEKAAADFATLDGSNPATATPSQPESARPVDFMPSHRASQTEGQCTLS